MATNESNNIADIVAEMSAASNSRSDRDWKKAQKAAQQERIDEQVEAARRATETLGRTRPALARDRNEIGTPRRHERRSSIEAISASSLRLRPRRVRLRHGRSPRRTSRHPAIRRSEADAGGDGAAVAEAPTEATAGSSAAALHTATGRPARRLSAQ